jgi:type VI secretion system protein ImpA
MSSDLEKPPVVDLELLLQPISEDSPSGQSLRYSGLYDEIREARRADEKLEQGDWQTELKVADYRKVIDLALPALSSETKDLQISVWLGESLTKIHGFVGLRDSLRLITGLQARFWDTLHPEIDDGDMESRANAIAWYDTQLSLAVKTVPFTGFAGYSYLDWEDSKTFDIPEAGLDALPEADRLRFKDLATRAERERRVTAELWRKEKTQTRRAPMEEINFVVEECWAAFSDLNKVIEEKFDRNQMPGLNSFKKSLEDVHGQIKQLLEEKRSEEPDPEPIEEIVEEGVSTNGTGGKSAVPAGAIQNRTDALRRLDEIASYFKKTEPHSPVSYLVQRAVKWGNMPLDGWLQDVIKDQSVLVQLQETLGFGKNDGTGESG